MNIEQLKAQIAATEQELENAKSNVYRADGALQAFKFILAQMEAGEKSPAPDAKVG